MKEIVANESVELIDFSSPVRGREGVMYPLKHWRPEEVDLDFVMDIGERELVVAPNLTMLSGAKGGALWMIGVILLVDAVFMHIMIKFIALHNDYVAAAIPGAFICISIPFCIWILSSIRYKSRIEPVLFNRADGTVSHYGADRVTTLDWVNLKPFIRIVWAVGTAGGAQVQLLILAEFESTSRTVGREVVVGRGDVVSAGSLRYGFFEAYMGKTLEALPAFRLASLHMSWMQRIASSIWMVPALGASWLGERPWSGWIALGTIINTVIALPLLAAEIAAAKISLGPRGEAALGPWKKRFAALPEDSKLRTLARHRGGMFAPARRWLFASIAIGCAFWLAVGAFWVMLIISKTS
ncbi:hypothetical protein [Stenotrophomonas rhizophila]|uniref:hypothetical protein n=1 Tax=Stenotrophomonas rhizophila TaxID=216778 RepID=UPI0010C14F0C|nr:hypothetical protein [Stenotrophomonas rhizophila]